MSGDHNMNQTDSGWRKRQIALNKKAENARELGLDYEPNKTIIEMAKECDLIAGNAEHGIYTMALERFAELVRADEREQCLHAAEVAASLLNDPIAAIRARGQA